MPDVYMEIQHWPAKRGVPKPTLVVSLSELDDILDVCQLPTCLRTRLLGEIRSRAGDNADSEQQVLDWMGEEYLCDEDRPVGGFAVDAGTVAALAVEAMTDEDEVCRALARGTLADVLEEAGLPAEAAKVRAEHVGYFVPYDEGTVSDNYQENRENFPDLTHEAARRALVHHEVFESLAAKEAHAAGIEEAGGQAFDTQKEGLEYVERCVHDLRPTFDRDAG